MDTQTNLRHESGGASQASSELSTRQASREQEDAYQARKAHLIGQIQSGAGEPLALSKDTSNLFRDRLQDPKAKRKLDVRAFNHVLELDERAEWVDVEGMTPYLTLVDATLRRGYMPAVVPELKSITVGGAVAGLGIEASSFRYGLVHETVSEMEILLGDGRIVTCSPAGPATHLCEFRLLGRNQNA